MSRLTRKTYWDGIHVNEQAHLPESFTATDGTTLPIRKKVTATLKKILGSTVVERMSNYDDYLLWSVILANTLPDMNGAKVVEIGSAPGDYITEFSKRHGCIPYGVEYSTVGVELNRDVFRQNGFEPDNVIHADFFSDQFAAQYREKFDGVMSKGFIEHFDDVKSVIDRHMHLLKPGGYLIVTVPNLRGANYWLSRLFDEGAIPRHNLTIMQKAAYSELYQREDLETLFCDYYGAFSFYLFTTGPSAVRRYLLKACHKFQPLLNLTFRTAFAAKPPEVGLFSPFLLYIGRKIGSKNTRPLRGAPPSAYSGIQHGFEM